MTDRFELRLPRGARIALAVLGTAFTITTVGFVIATVATGSAGPLAGVVTFGLAAAVCWRFFATSLAVTGGELFARNYFHTKRLTRADVEGFEIRRPPFSPTGWVISAVRREGKGVLLDATRRAAIGESGREQLEGWRTTLESWRAAGGP